VRSQASHALLAVVACILWLSLCAAKVQEGEALCGSPPGLLMSWLLSCRASVLWRGCLFGSLALWLRAGAGWGCCCSVYRQRLVKIRKAQKEGGRRKWKKEIEGREGRKQIESKGGRERAQMKQQAWVLWHSC
jgi:hypothetical protein